MAKEHIGILIPGLGNSNKWLEWSIKRISTPSFRAIIFDPEWTKGESQLKVTELFNQIKTFRDKGHRVSLIGTSAGGSLALKVFHTLQTEITAGIAICACLRIPKNIPSKLAANFVLYPVHKKIVSQFAKIEPVLTSAERKRILTLQPLWDHVIPVQTMSVKGASNKKMIIAEHSLSIAAALTFYTRTITNFIYSIENTKS